MNYHLLNFADEKFKHYQDRLNKIAEESKCFKNIFSYTKEDLKRTVFYNTYHHILDQPKGCGYCLWKSYYIWINLITGNIQENDILIYSDSADVIEPRGLTQYLANMSTDVIVMPGVFPQKMYTKRDCFYGMHCDEEYYWNAIQLEAGIFICKNTKFATKFVELWLIYCLCPELLTDDPNIYGLPNFPEFKEGRYDQSILTNLVYAYLKTPSNTNIKIDNNIRQWITCNVL